MKKLLGFLILSLTATITTYSQPRLVGGPCEGCEAVLEFEDRSKLSSVDTLPDFETEGTKIKISGTVYKPDGKTPAPNVILYLHQTNDEGVYPTKGDETGWGKRHGYIRTWLKTDEKGQYTFYTQKPHFYGRAPAHIHLTILEPNGKYYYAQDFLFEGDQNLTSRQKNNKTPRAGTLGILSLKEVDGILSAERDLILGKHVPGY